MERKRALTRDLFLPPEANDADLARLILARLPEDDAQLAADRRQAVRLAAERAREASAAFRRDGADWDEIRALDLPAAAIEAALLALLPARVARFLDIGTGTGRLLEVVAPRADRALGVDASRDMLALARARLSERGLAERLYRATLPTVIVWGDADRLMPLPYAEAFQHYLPQAELVVIPGAAHMSPYEQTGEVLSALQKLH
jgi:ArsR family transcriptional regulator